MGEHALKGVKPGLANACGQTDNGGLKNTAHAIAFRFGVKDRRFHFFLFGAVKKGKGEVAKGAHVGFHVKEGTILHTAAGGYVRADANAQSLQRRDGYSTRGTKTCGNATGKVTAASLVCESVILFKGGADACFQVT